MKLLSWNVNGIRAVINKDFVTSMRNEDADIICLQETKAQPDQVLEALKEMSNEYNIYANSAERKGYSSTAILSRKEPISVVNDMGIEEHDKEGRVICAEYEDFYLVNVYTPNSGSELLRLEYRSQWDIAFYEYIKELESRKPVIVCGDLNVAHKAIDLKNAKANYNKSAGYMQEEIDGMDRYLNGGFVDTYRHFYPDKIDAYSWWSYRAGARARNIGWRIDYFLSSQSYISNILTAAIHPDIMGSDHCPISIITK